jgi:hypothetical protein
MAGTVNSPKVAESCLWPARQQHRRTAHRRSCGLTVPAMTSRSWPQHEGPFKTDSGPSPSMGQQPKPTLNGCMQARIRRPKAVDQNRRFGRTVVSTSTMFLHRWSANGLRRCSSPLAGNEDSTGCCTPVPLLCKAGISCYFPHNAGGTVLQQVSAKPPHTDSYLQPSKFTPQEMFETAL